ncbi:unnamed protein product [Rotaria sp. Silwood2]|nr:unnamed protein product [Rotaria sp. Silwood2]
MLIVSTLIECSLRQPYLNSSSSSSSSTSSNSTNNSQTSPTIGINDSCYHPRIYSRYGTTGLTIKPCHPDTLYSSTNILNALSKLLPNSLSSSNLYLKPIPGLFEITPLNNTMHSSTTNAPPPNITLTTNSHHLYNPTRSNSIPPSISRFNATNPYPFSFPTANINAYHDRLYITSTIASSFPTSTTTIDNQINNNNLISTSPWLPHLASKFKDKQSLEKEKFKLIAKKK